MIVLGLVKALGLRGTVILACLLVLAVTAYGVALDLGLVEPPAQASPAPKPAAGQPRPSRAAVADIPAGYLRLYQQGARRCPGLSWAVLAGVGKVESDHGRTRLPGVRSAGTTPGRQGRCSSASAWAGPATPGRSSGMTSTATAAPASMTRVTPSQLRPAT